MTNPNFLNTRVFNRAVACTSAILLAMPAAGLLAGGTGTEAYPYTESSVTTTTLNKGGTVGAAVYNKLENYEATFTATIRMGYGTNCNRLLISDYGSLTSSKAVYVGYGSASNATVGNYNVLDVSGTAAALDLTTVSGSSGLLVIGYYGSNNSMTIGEAGSSSVAGTVKTSSSYVGYRSTSAHNSVVISGSGASWTDTGALYVGNEGSYNTVLITNGADLSTGGTSGTQSYIGYGSSATGCASYGSHNSVSVSGPGSTWTSTGPIYVGNFGSSNNLTVVDGGAVTATQMLIGVGYSSNTALGSNNSVIVGSGSSVTTTNVLFVGKFGSSNYMSITGGSSVVSSGAYVGYGMSGSSAFGSNNAVVLNGNGSNLTVNGNLYVGYYGSNNKIIAYSGSLIKVNGTVGYGCATSSQDTGNFIGLYDGYLAVYGEYTGSSLTALLSGIKILNNTGDWVAATQDNTIIKYYSLTDTTSVAETGYSLAGYTVITSLVPEPSTYALFGGFGALAFVLLRKKSIKAKVQA